MSCPRRRRHFGSSKLRSRHGLKRHPMTTTLLPEIASNSRSHQRPNGHRTLLLAIFVVGVVVRLSLWLYFRNEPISIWDEQDYNTLATNIVQHGEFTFVPGDTASSMRPP